MYMSQIAASALGSGAGQSLGNEVLAVIQNKVSPTNPNNRASGNASAAVDGSIDPSTGSNAANANGTAANGLTKPASDGGGGQGSSQSSGQAVPGSSSNNSGTSSNATSPANKYSSYSASQNPGRNANGLFSGASSTGSINSGLSSNNASQDYSSSGARDSTYGSGNATPTAKVVQDSVTLAMGDIITAELLGNSPSGQIILNSVQNIVVAPQEVTPISNQINKWSALMSGYMNAGSGIQTFMRDAIILDVIEGLSPHAFESNNGEIFGQFLLASESNAVKDVVGLYNDLKSGDATQRYGAIGSILGGTATILSALAIKGVGMFASSSPTVIAEEIPSAVSKSSEQLSTQETNLGQNSNYQIFNIAERVTNQLQDPRLGNLTGALDLQKLNDLANNPTAQILFDTATGNINIVQELNGVLLRITVPSDEFTIISVGPIRQRNITNSLSSGRFIPIEAQPINNFTNTTHLGIN